MDESLFLISFFIPEAFTKDTNEWNENSIFTSATKIALPAGSSLSLV